MLFFDIPSKFNGLQLAEELGLPATAVTITDDKLRVDAPKSKESAIKSAIESHTPKEPTVIDKLNSAGIDLDELRVALGL